jgi:hypothetical protein
MCHFGKTALFSFELHVKQGKCPVAPRDNLRLDKHNTFAFIYIICTEWYL